MKITENQQEYLTNFCVKGTSPFKTCFTEHVEEIKLNAENEGFYYKLLHV